MTRCNATWTLEDTAIIMRGGPDPLARRLRALGLVGDILDAGMMQDAQNYRVRKGCYNNDVWVPWRGELQL